MQLLKHFKELTVQPKNAKELKGLILQLAIQGKLTANWRKENPDVEPASVLMKRIQKEKAELVKDKPILEISKDMIPYEIPKKWNWYKLVELSSINGGFAFKSSNYIDEGVRVIRISDFDENGFKDHRVVRHSYSGALESYVLEDKNILIAMTGGTVGKSLFIDNVPEVMVVNQRVATIKIFKPIYEAYINCVIPTKLIQDVIEEAKNSTNDNISMSNIKGFNIPLPPLEEQKEIVKVVKTLFKEVEQLEQLTLERMALKENFVTSALNQLTTNTAKENWTYLQAHFKNFFNETTNIKKLRETVLQLAVQGKLTADWHKANLNIAKVNVSELEISRKEIQIEAAKNKGQKTFKYKESVKIEVNGKSKGVDELFNIPDSWEWTSLGQLSWSINDGPHFSPKYVDKGIPMISGRNVTYKKGIDFSSAKLVSREDHLEFTKRGKPEVGDVLLTKGGTTGVPCVVETTKEFSVWVHVALIKIMPAFVDPYYLKMSLASPFVYKQSQEQTHGIGNKDLGLTRMIYFAIPLPPLEEQNAIVEKVNALMELCDALEQEVKHSQEQSELLMKSCLREVFEGEIKTV